MNLRYRFSLLICFILPAQIILPQENYKVRDISFEGNQTLSKSEILENTMMYETGWISENIFGDDPYFFSQELMDGDLAQIKYFYQSEGFLKVRIEKPVFVTDNEDKSLEIILTVHEGDPVIVDTAILNANGAFTGVDSDSVFRELASSLTLAAGERFRDESLNGDRGIIYDFISDIGYPYCKIDYNLSVDTLKNRVKIIWSIHPGLPVDFGSVSIEGNERFSSDVIIPRIRFNEGDHYSQSSLLETQRYIYGLGLYSIVSVQADLENESNRVVPVTITLKELPRYRTKLGIGYGKDEKFRVSIDQTINGFLGTIGRLTIEGRHSDLEPYKIGLKYILPDFIYPFTTLIIYPYIRKQTEPAFTENRKGNRTTIQRNVIWDIDLAFTHTFEIIDLDTSSISQENRGSDLTNKYNKSAITFSLLRITSDPFFDPEGGMYHALQVTFSGLGLNSRYNFNKSILELRRYDQITGWLTVASKIKIGNISSNDSSGFIPVEERFYAGGANSIRGWGRSELGPVGFDGRPLGGNSLLEFGIEFRYPIAGELAGVIFTDFGNVWRNSWTYKLNELEYSVGTGLRYRTPIGPLRLDFAIPLFYDNPKIQFYLSVGHAF